MKGSMARRGRKKTELLTPVEARIMAVLWKSESGMTVTEVREQLKPLRHYNTVLTILRILVSKGFVKGVSGGSRSFAWTAAVPRGDVLARAVIQVATQYFNGDVRELANYANSISRGKTLQ